MRHLRAWHAFAGTGGLALCAGLIVVAPATGAPAAPAMASPPTVPIQIRLVVQLDGLGIGYSYGYPYVQGPAFAVDAICVLAHSLGINALCVYDEDNDAGNGTVGLIGTTPICINLTGADVESLWNDSTFDDEQGDGSCQNPGTVQATESPDGSSNDDNIDGYDYTSIPKPSIPPVSIPPAPIPGVTPSPAFPVA
jgi:hypothetical protein